MLMLEISPYRSSDAIALTDIFYQTIHTIGREYYSEQQVNAWAPLPIDYQLWQQKFDQTPPFVATNNGQIIGFMTLCHNGHIEWTFTHKNYQKQGVAQQLYLHLEAQARNQGLNKLTVDASFFAQPFFAKQGFATLTKNNIERHGIILTNFSMEKTL